MAVAAPPFVAYSTLTEARVPGGQWPAVYASLQALKGHVQEYPGCQGFDVFVRIENGATLVHVYTTWDTAVQLEVYLERGYTFERMLADVASEVTPSRSLVMEKVF
jgi:Antibiotic biosynthesis monooxygenase